MKQPFIDLLKALSSAYGVSGYEHEIRDLLRNHCADYADEFTEDALGNLIMLKRGTGPSNSTAPRRTIMLSAHTDENGAMVTGIDRGFLSFTNVGGLDIRQLMGHEVVVFGRNGQQFPGLIISRPPHFQGEDRSKFPAMGEYKIDLGLPAAVVAENIRVGDLIALKKDPVHLMGNFLAGKAFDNRASVVAMCVALYELTRLKHEWDVYAVASSQEEVGMRGAGTSAYALNPSAAIAIDVTFAKAPLVAPQHELELDKGPVIAVGANLHPVMVQTLRDVASELEIGLQTEPAPSHTGTDAWAIQTAREGIPTALLGIPMRYMHSPIEMISTQDMIRTGRLMAHFIAHLSESFIADLTPSEGLEVVE